MRRLVLFAFIVGSLCTVLALNSQAQLAKGLATGVLKKFDPKTGSFTIEVTSRKTKDKAAEKKEYDYKVVDDTKVVLLAGEEKQELFGKKGLASPLVKEGAQTSAYFDKNNKVYEVRFGPVVTKKK